MSDFAKLFQSNKYGQILAVRQDNDEGIPELRVNVHPDGLGVCSIALSFSDEDKDEGYEKRDDAFEILDLETAEETVKLIFDSIAS